MTPATDRRYRRGRTGLIKLIVQVRRRNRRAGVADGVEDEQVDLARALDALEHRAGGDPDVAGAVAALLQLRRAGHVKEVRVGDAGAAAAARVDDGADVRQRVPR